MTAWLIGTAGLIATSLHAQSIASTNKGIVIARESSIKLEGSWAVEGVRTPGKIIAGETRVAVLDPVANEVRIVELENGRTTRAATAETPVDGLFIGLNLFILARDGRRVQRIAADGTITNLDTAADPAFIREAGGHIYVYARVAGVLYEIDPTLMKNTRSASVPAFASDFELDEKNAYLVGARAAKIHVVDLETMKSGDDIDVGAVPVDIAFVKGSTALSARTLAVADPSAKRVWVIEGVQSLTQAIVRGFLRGLLGLGLFSGGSSQFPTGVDRVFIRGKAWIAYDSSSGTLYRFSKSRGTAIAMNVTPNGFALTADGVVWWDDAVRRLQKLRIDE